MNITLKNHLIWRTGLLIFGAYTFIFAVQIPQVYFNSVNNPQFGDSWILVARLAVAVYLAAITTPFVIWLGYLFPVRQPHLWRNLFFHLLFSIVLGAVLHVAYILVLIVFNLTSVESLSAGLLNFATLFAFIYSSLIRYPAVIGIQQAYFYFRESQERAFRLQQAELEMLKMQLHPHFFFNTLNAISALMYRSPKEADRMIVRLGDMFRVVLRKDKTQEVVLKEELEFLESFLQIHQILMGKRLKTEWRIAPETLDALVPNLILQPLAENAIQHGLAPLEAGGQITIRAARHDGNLLLQVSDNGMGFDPAVKGLNGGIGLSNTRARLENLYGEGQKFSIDESLAGGVSVKIEIPFRERTAD
ncbi:MAG: histidine kinase [Acidobacteriota bacterium]|nr:histidine kinase [Acidobacteriota bacterium]